MSGDLRQRRAETLYVWYRNQPEHATTLDDAHIADKLHAEVPDEGWCREDGRPQPKVVQQVRRWTDRQTTGPWADVFYGTRENGGSRNGLSHLRDGKPAQMMATQTGTTAQLVAVDQRVRQMQEERARQTMKFYAERDDWNRLGEFAKALACDHAGRDVEQFGYLTQRTEAELVMAGLR